MENIIGELIKIENMAGLVTKKIEEEQKKLPLDIMKRVQEINAEAEKQTEAKIKSIRGQVDRDSEKEIAERHSYAEKRSAEMKQDFKDHHEEWENEIFRRIISR